MSNQITVTVPVNVTVKLEGDFIEADALREDVLAQVDAIRHGVAEALALKYASLMPVGETRNDDDIHIVDLVATSALHSYDLRAGGEGALVIEP